MAGADEHAGESAFAAAFRRQMANPPAIFRAETGESWSQRFTTATPAAEEARRQAAGLVLAHLDGDAERALLLLDGTTGEDARGLVDALVLLAVTALEVRPPRDARALWLELAHTMAGPA